MGIISAHYVINNEQLSPRYYIRYMDLFNYLYY